MGDEIQVSPPATIFICRLRRRGAKGADYNIMPPAGTCLSRYHIPVTRHQLSAQLAQKAARTSSLFPTQKSPENGGLFYFSISRRKAIYSFQ